MKKMYPKLFERGKIGRMETGNRIVKAATGMYLSNTDGSVSDRLIKFYEEIARGGAGIVFVDDGAVLKEPHMGVCIGSDEYVPGLALLTKTISDHGAKSALQIDHPGRDAVFVGAPKVIGPSRIQWEPWYEHGFAVPKELTIEEIHELVNAYGNAAKRAQRAGFDMVEVLAGFGTLVSNFLSPTQNKRNDMYGGSLHNRMRFLVEIIRDIRKKVGADYPLCVRLAMIDYEPEGIRLEQSLEVGKVLEEIGVDVINVGGGSHAEGMHGAASMLKPLGLHVSAAAALKEVVSIPVMVVGSILTPEFAEEILKSGKADFIALGRPLLADPEWPRKAKEGRPEDIRPCIRCNDGCHDRSLLRGTPIKCSVNPTLPMSEGLSINRVDLPKNVAVVGGGPAGMEAARVCALRGHSVTLFEKRELGGALIEASVPEFKSDIRRLTDYYITQLKKLNIKVVNNEVTVENIKDEKYDVVFIAVGASLKKLDVTGIDNPIVTNALDVLSGKAKVGERVLIIGGGVTGAETGLFLAEQGKEVTFVEMLDEFMPTLGFNRPAYHVRLSAQKVKVYTGNRLEAVYDNAAVIVDKKGRRQELSVDSIVLSSGFAPQTTLRQRLEDETDLEVYAIGDCVEPRMIYDAIHEGFLTARRI